MKDDVLAWHYNKGRMFLVKLTYKVGCKEEEKAMGYRTVLIVLMSLE
jgi:hypothetical protein